jgi:hypothetical protein
MKNAYRIPSGKFPLIQRFPSQATELTEPITEILVNSVIAAPAEGHRLRPNDAVELRGVAWDGGYGIRRVEVSSDGGRQWQQAELGKDLGRFAFRSWSFRFTPSAAGNYKLVARASNGAGQTQAESLIFNPAGYHNNLMRPLTVVVG